MATCPLCLKGGWLKKMGLLGVCDACSGWHLQWLEMRLKQLKESASLAENSRNEETRLLRYGDVLKILRELHELERKGVATITPPPSTMIPDWTGREALARQEIEQRARLRLEHKAQELRSVAGFEARGWTHLQWCSQGDDHGCKKCGKRNGKVLTLAQARRLLETEYCDSNSAAGHCRCGFVGKRHGTDG